MKYAILSALIALGLAGNALAGDTATVRLISGGVEHAVEVDLDSLKVGESRQLATQAGTPAIVSRTEEGLRVEVAGKTTDVALTHAATSLWMDADGAKQVRVIKIDKGDVEEIDLGDGQRKIVMVRKGEAFGSGMDEAEIAALLAEVREKAGHDVVDADGDKIIVTRKLTRARSED